MIRLPHGQIAVTREELSAVMYEVKGAKPVTIVARTKPDLIGGKKCPYAGATKLSRVNGVINFSYKNAVNRVRERLGGPVNENDEIEYFEPQPRHWGQRLYSEDLLSSGKHRMLPLVAKNVTEPCVSFKDIKDVPAEELYLEMKVEQALDELYELDGAEIPKEAIQPYLRERKQEVVLRDYRFDNLEEIVMDGTVYVMATQVPEPAVLRELRKGELTAV